MTKTRSIYAVITSLVILSFVIGAFAQENQTKTQVEQRAKVQLRYEDQNGDGVCDYFGTEYQGGNRQAMSSQHRNGNGKGNGSGNGEGKYTRTRSRSKDGDCEGSGKRGNGGGSGRGKGQGHNRRR